MVAASFALKGIFGYGGLLIGLRRAGDNRSGIFRMIGGKDSMRTSRSSTRVLSSTEGLAISARQGSGRGFVVPQFILYGCSI
jgi:hypothetical protein